MTGAVSSKRVTEESKGFLSAVGNRTKSVKAKESLTARLIGQADVKAGLNDPAVVRGNAVDQQTKGTPGITG